MKLLILLIAIILTSCTKQMDRPELHSYETCDVFITGEVLQPDSLHSTTLVVRNGDSLTLAVLNADSWEGIKEGLKLYCEPIK